MKAIPAQHIYMETTILALWYIDGIIYLRFEAYPHMFAENSECRASYSVFLTECAPFTTVSKNICWQVKSYLL